MIEVLNPGVYTSVQDLGRNGYRNLGIPSSGFMDQYSAFYANARLGNSVTSPLLELAQAGHKFKFHETATIILSGARVDAFINSTPLRMDTLTSVESNDVLSVKTIREGVWTYIGISGNIMYDEVLSSKSQFLPLTKKACLVKGDFIRYDSSKNQGVHKAKIRFDRERIFKKEIEVTKGPEFQLLSDADVVNIIQNEFSISAQSNRMAYGFNARIGGHNYSILTSPVLPGTIQWTPSGELFALMRDAQSTGGYPRILQIQEKDITVLSQKPPGKTIKFKLVL